MSLGDLYWPFLSNFLRFTVVSCMIFLSRKLLDRAYVANSTMFWIGFKTDQLLIYVRIFEMLWKRFFTYIDLKLKSPFKCRDISHDRPMVKMHSKCLLKKFNVARR